MIVRPNVRKLVLRLRDPTKVLTLIPGAKQFVYKGAELVAVPHRLDEVKVLQNIGLKPPHPVNYYYGWPGRFPPFQAQRDTAAFLTSHNRAYCLNGMGCVDSETEYLTPTGWRRVSEYDGGLVAQYEPSTGEATFVEPAAYQKLPCDEMYHIKTKYGLDQMLSPEHRVLLQAKGNADKQEVLHAEELYNRQEQWVETGRNKKSLRTIGWTQATIPVVYASKGGAGIPLTDEQLRVQIAVIADGHFANGTARCIVRLKKPRKIERLRALLAGAGIQFRERGQNTATASDFVVFTFAAPMRTKEFGPAFWEATPKQLAVVRDEVLHWDGSCPEAKPTRMFFSNSKASVDFVQYAFNAGGFVARIVVDDRGPTYEVLIRNNGAPLQLLSVNGSERRRVIERVPSTDGFKYCFTVPSSFLVFRRNGCVFVSGNSGKTMATLWAFDYRRELGLSKKLLVVAPLSTLERVWADEVFRNMPHLSYTVLHGSRRQRLDKLEQDVDIYVINHAGVKVIERELIARKDIDTVAIDELAQVGRNATTEQWVSLNALLKGRTCVWGLTGTPTPNKPTDAWAQCRLITPQTVPQFFTHFRAMTMRQVSNFKWISKDDALETVYNVMRPAIRISREDCVDLPPVMYETREVKLSKAQQALYNDMRDKYYALYKGGEITAVNAAVKLQRLVQIASGGAYDPKGKIIVIPPKDRIRLVLELIEEAASKVIVFVPFKAILPHLATEIGKHHTVATISGDVSKSDRDAIFGGFQNKRDPQVLIAQPAAMAHGLTLTAASVVVWFAPITSAEIYEQANARITRPGQKHAQLIAHIQATPVEEQLYGRLKDKTRQQNDLLDLFARGL